MKNCRVSLAAILALMLFLYLALNEASAEVPANGSFERVVQYPTNYLALNSIIKKALAAGWDLGPDQSFPSQWYPSAATRGGYLRISSEARFGGRSVELGKVGEIYYASYET